MANRQYSSLKLAYKVSRTEMQIAGDRLGNSKIVNGGSAKVSLYFLGNTFVLPIFIYVHHHFRSMGIRAYASVHGLEFYGH